MSSSKKVKVTHVADLIKPKKKYLYPCYCIRCKGAEVDARTQEKHTKEKGLWKSEDSRKHQENAIMAKKQKKLIISKKQKRVMMSSIPNSSQPNNEGPS